MFGLATSLASPLLLSASRARLGNRNRTSDLLIRIAPLLVFGRPANPSALESKSNLSPSSVATLDLYRAGIALWEANR